MATLHQTLNYANLSQLSKTKFVESNGSWVPDPAEQYSQAQIDDIKTILTETGYEIQAYSEDPNSGYAGVFLVNSNDPNDKVLSFELIPALYYMLTENHFVELSYNYRNRRELDEPGNPTAQRNRVTLGFVFRFPKKWD